MTGEETAAVAVEQLVKRYPKAEVDAVDGITCSVGRGEVFGLLGPNGAGKTTTVGVLRVRARSQLAVVPQRSNLIRTLPGRRSPTSGSASPRSRTCSSS